MAKLCSQCGYSLTREDSRFCNHCGALALPDASSSFAPRRTEEISGEHPSTASGTERASTRPALREQIAFAPSSAPLAPDGAPPRLGKPGKMDSRSIAGPPVQSAALHTSPKVENPPSNAGRLFSPGGSRLPQRELRIKVWENENSDSPDLDAPAAQHNGHAEIAQNKQREEQAHLPQTLSQDKPEGNSQVEDLPTTPMPSTFAPDKDLKPLSPAARNDLHAGVSAQPGEEDWGDADLPTRPLAVNPPLPNTAQANRPSGRPFPAQSYRQTVPPQPSPGQPIDQRQQGLSAQVNPGQMPIVQRPVTPALQTPYPTFQQPAPTPAATGIVAGPSRPIRRKSKMRVVVVLVMLLVLLGGGLAYWIIAYQPFSVPAVTRTSLSFSNTSLGIALQYPQGWTTQLDSAHQTVSFFDANHIYQVNISVTARNGSSVTTFVNKEVAQLGLTAQKNLSPITFAGTSWQQVQGKVLVSGATDTETLLVALHGDHFYAIVFYAIVQVAPAPVVTYADADHLFFSVFRASFQFL